MKISVNEGGVGREVNPYNPYDMEWWLPIELNIKELPALDTNGNKLPVGEYEVELVWQAKYGWDRSKWYIISDKYYEDMKHATVNSYRQIYMAAIVPESKEVEILTSLSTGKSNWQEKAEARQQAKEQPKKEVDTIEQAAEKHLMECPETGDEIREAFIAGANHIKSTHVPIEEVIDAITKWHGFPPESLINQIRNLIKPQ